MSETNHIKCPYCGDEFDYTEIMGDGDWDDVGYNPYDTECPCCAKYITITQEEVEIIRYFRCKKFERKEVEDK